MKSTKTSLAIMAIFFIMPSALIVNPAIQSIADAYPSIPYTMVLLLSTVPLLIIVPMSLISGGIAGTKVKYKHLLIVAMSFYIIGGSIPFVLRDFYAVLAGRAIFGIGVGIATPLANGLIIRLFSGQRRANMMGIGSVVINVASTLFILLSGFISAIDMNFMWLIHLIALVPLVLMVLFLPEPEKIDNHDTAKVKIPAGVYVYSLATVFIYMNLNPMLLNMSTIITVENIGNAAVAGTILSMYTVGGILGGAIFGKVFKLTGKMTIPVAILLIGLGLGITNFSHSVLWMIVGCTIAGIGFFIMFPAVMMEAGQKVTMAASAMASAMILGSINLGGFISSFYLGLLARLFHNQSPRFPIFIGMLIMFLAAVVWAALMILKKSSADIAVESL